MCSSDLYLHTQPQEVPGWILAKCHDEQGFSIEDQKALFAEKGYRINMGAFKRAMVFRNPQTNYREAST